MRTANRSSQMSRAVVSGISQSSENPADAPACVHVTIAEGSVSEAPVTMLARNVRQETRLTSAP